jgi:hypothetical protein
MDAGSVKLVTMLRHISNAKSARSIDYGQASRQSGKAPKLTIDLQDHRCSHDASGQIWGQLLTSSGRRVEEANCYTNVTCRRAFFLATITESGSTDEHRCKDLAFVRRRCCLGFQPEVASSKAICIRVSARERPYAGQPDLARINL